MFVLYDISQSGFGEHFKEALRENMGIVVISDGRRIRLALDHMVLSLNHWRLYET
jgi:hypothetical protein